MKKGKWMRLGMGLCLLVSILFLPGTEVQHGCTECKNSPLHGVLEIRNNTLYNIVVQLPDEFGGTFFTIKSDPNAMRFVLLSGKYRVLVYIVEPLSQIQVFYRDYYPVVQDDERTVVLTIRTPLNYVPIPPK